VTRAVRWILGLVLALALVGCQGGTTESGPEPAPGTPSGTATGSPEEPPGPAERLGLAAGWGPTEAELDAAVRRARDLPLPDLAGQVIVAAWSGTAAPVRAVRGLHLGGVIAFDDNVDSPRQIAAVNRTLGRQVRRPWPLFLAVDQEGGVVERVPTTAFPSFMSAGAARDAALTTGAYRRYGAELAGLGFTVDFAPDADVTSGPDDPTIGSRSAGSDPDLVARQATAAATGLAASGVAPVLKHFPGHGSVPADSHLTLPVQTRTMTELRRVDLAPFAAAIHAGLPAVMIGHLDVRAVDARVPASLSRAVVTGLLRRQLGFGGLVVTDSLQMAAVTRRDPAAVAVRAMRAGADVLLMPPDPAVARRALVRAVRAGVLPRERLLQAAARQIALLQHLDRRRPAATAPLGSARAASRRLSAAAVTVVSGPCRGRLVAERVVPAGDPESVAAFGTAARRAGLTVLEPRQPPSRLSAERPRPERRAGERRRSFRLRAERWQRQERRRRQLLGEWEADEQQRLAGATRIGFAGYGDGPVAGEIAVATDAPYPLAGSPGAVRIATFGDTPGAMTALVDVLLGEAGAPGRLPVAVPGVDRAGCDHGG
jgi:beta-N-acetylhexosaminidase